LGTSFEAMRKQAQRGGGEFKKENGPWYVYLPVSEESKDRRSAVEDPSGKSPLIEKLLRSENQFLREFIWHYTDVVMSLTVRIPLPEQREAPEG
jgi:hypothetical protein